MNFYQEKINKVKSVKQLQMNGEMEKWKNKEIK